MRTGVIFYFKIYFIHIKRNLFYIATSFKKDKMKKFSLLIILTTISISCSKSSDDNGEGLSFLKSQGSCDESNLDWLQEMIDDYELNEYGSEEYFYFSKAIYNGQQVIIHGNCCAVCNTAFLVYDCSGEFLGVIGIRDIDISMEDITQHKLIWPEDSPCFK